MTDLRDDYQGYCINITRYAGRWRATIYGPDSKQPMLGPQSDDPTEAVDKANDGLRCLIAAPWESMSHSPKQTSKCGPFDLPSVGHASEPDTDRPILIAWSSFFSREAGSGNHLLYVHK